MKRKLLSMLLALSMVLTLLPTTALADAEVKAERMPQPDIKTPAQALDGSNVISVKVKLPQVESKPLDGIYKTVKVSLVEGTEDQTPTKAIAGLNTVTLTKTDHYDKIVEDWITVDFDIPAGTLSKVTGRIFAQVEIELGDISTKPDEQTGGTYYLYENENATEDQVFPVGGLNEKTFLSSDGMDPKAYTEPTFITEVAANTTPAKAEYDYAVPALKSVTVSIDVTATLSEETDSPLADTVSVKIGEGDPFNVEVADPEVNLEPAPTKATYTVVIPGENFEGKLNEGNAITVTVTPADGFAFADAVTGEVEFDSQGGHDYRIPVTIGQTPGEPDAVPAIGKVPTEKLTWSFDAAVKGSGDPAFTATSKPIASVVIFDPAGETVASPITEATAGTKYTEGTEGTKTLTYSGELNKGDDAAGKKIEAALKKEGKFTMAVTLADIFKIGDAAAGSGPDNVHTFEAELTKDAEKADGMKVTFKTSGENGTVVDEASNALTIDRIRKPDGFDVTATVAPTVTPGTDAPTPPLPESYSWEEVSYSTSGDTPTVTKDGGKGIIADLRSYTSTTATIKLNDKAKADDPNYNATYVAMTATYDDDSAAVGVFKVTVDENKIKVTVTPKSGETGLSQTPLELDIDDPAATITFEYGLDEEETTTNGLKAEDYTADIADKATVVMQEDDTSLLTIDNEKHTIQANGNGAGRATVNLTISFSDKYELATPTPTPSFTVEVSAKDLSKLVDITASVLGKDPLTEKSPLEILSNGSETPKVTLTATHKQGKSGVSLTDILDEAVSIKWSVEDADNIIDPTSIPGPDTKVSEIDIKLANGAEAEKTATVTATVKLTEESTEIVVKFTVKSVAKHTVANDATLSAKVVDASEVDKDPVNDGGRVILMAGGKKDDEMGDEKITITLCTDSVGGVPATPTPTETDGAIKSITWTQNQLEGEPTLNCVQDATTGKLTITAAGGESGFTTVEAEVQYYDNKTMEAVGGSKFFTINVEVKDGEWRGKFTTPTTPVEISLNAGDEEAEEAFNNVLKIQYKDGNSVKLKTAKVVPSSITWTTDISSVGDASAVTNDVNDDGYVSFTVTAKAKGSVILTPTPSGSVTTGSGSKNVAYDAPGNFTVTIKGAPTPAPEISGTVFKVNEKTVTPAPAALRKEISAMTEDDAAEVVLTTTEVADGITITYPDPDGAAVSYGVGAVPKSITVAPITSPNEEHTFALDESKNEIPGANNSTFVLIAFSGAASEGGALSTYYLIKISVVELKPAEPEVSEGIESGTKRTEATNAAKDTGIDTTGNTEMTDAAAEWLAEQEYDLADAVAALIDKKGSELDATQLANVVIDKEFTVKRNPVSYDGSTYVIDIAPVARVVARTTGGAGALEVELDSEEIWPNNGKTVDVSVGIPTELAAAVETQGQVKIVNSDAERQWVLNKTDLKTGSNGKYVVISVPHFSEFTVTATSGETPTGAGGESTSTGGDFTDTDTEKKPESGATTDKDTTGSSGSGGNSTAGKSGSGNSGSAMSKGAAKAAGFIEPATTVTAPSTGGGSTGVGGFTDVPYGHSFATEIAWAQSNGILGGYNDGSFRPSANTTRQALWMVLARMSGTYPANMAEARAWSINSGISDGTNGEGNMSRQQFITMLYRYAQMMGLTISGSADLGSFSDSGVVASYAREAIAWGVANGIITGTTDGRLNPEGTATRAHFAAFVYRFANLNLAPAASADTGMNYDET